MNEASVLRKIDPRGVGTLTLNRPSRHNAFDDKLIAQLSHDLDQLAKRDDVRVLVITGNGHSFSAGADAEWMRRSGDYDEAANLADAQALAELLHRLDHMPIPTIARINGVAIGGGVGLVACSDIAISVAHATFATPEVRLGLIPAVISPYVLRAISARMARRYFLTGDVFSAQKACEIGLVHEAVAPELLDATVDHCINQLLKAGPKAQKSAKSLIHHTDGRPIDHALLSEKAAEIAQIRSTREAKAGLDAFLEKRAPEWSPST